MTAYDLITTKEFASSKPLTPERELLVATLDRAVLDFYGTNQDDYEAAKQWLFFSDEDSQEIFSFSWICDNLGVDSQAARRRILELNIPRQVAQAHRWLRNKVQSRDGILQEELAAA